MHMDRAERQPKTACVQSLRTGGEPLPPQHRQPPARCAGCEDTRPIRPARAASVSAEPAQAYPNRDTRGNHPAQGVGEFSQVFGIGYRVRVDWKSPAESCLPADMGPAIAPTAILGYG